MSNQKHNKIVEGKKYYNYKAFKDVLKRIREIPYDAETSIYCFFHLLFVIPFLLFNHDEEKLIDKIIIISSPFIAIIISLIATFNEKGLWVIIKDDHLIVTYLFYPKQKVLYSEIGFILLSDYYIAIYDDNQDYDDYLIELFGGFDFWREVARLKSIPLRIEYFKNLDYENTERYKIIQDKQNVSKKISFDKWRSYLKFNSDIKITNKTTFENYPASFIVEDKIRYYYEWKVENNCIAYLRYVDGEIWINIYKNRETLVEQIKDFLKADFKD